MKIGAPRPGWIPTIAAIVGIGLTLSAAYWQYGRAAYKKNLQQAYSERQTAMPVALNAVSAEISAESLEFRKVTANGHYLTAHTIFLDNRTRDGIAGYEVVTPLHLSGRTQLVLVNRGWIRGERERSALPSIDTPTHEISVSGTAIVPSLRILELSGATIEGAVWQNLVLSRYRDVHKLNVMDFIIKQEDVSDDGLLRRWTPPGFGVRTHQIYAVQWLMFSSLILFFYVYYGYLRRDRKQDAAE